jgi:flagellin-specific chaperone FliS
MTEQQFIVFMEEYGQLVITTSIAIIVIIMLFHKIWPALTKAVEIGNTLGELPQTIERVEKKLEHLETTLNTVKGEVLPNGGGSLRDAINRTEKQLAVVGRIVAKHERDIRKK